MAHTLAEIKTILNDTAKSLAFQLTAHEEDELFQMFESIVSTLEKIQAFPVPEGTEPSNFPDNQRYWDNMREDEPSDLNLHTLDIFNNTKEFRNQMVVLNNVKK